MKSEPTEYSIDDLKQAKTGMWDGVRNYQVRNMMRDDMNVGDVGLFYHSNAKEIGVVGEMMIVSKAYPDPMQFKKTDKHYDPKSKKEDPRWLCVDVKFKKKFSRTVTLDEMKGEKKLTKMRLLQKGNRLSVIPITKAEYEHIVSMSKK